MTIFFMDDGNKDTVFSFSVDVKSSGAQPYANLRKNGEHIVPIEVLQNDIVYMNALEAFGGIVGVMISRAQELELMEVEA